MAIVKLFSLNCVLVCVCEENNLPRNSLKKKKKTFCPFRLAETNSTSALMHVCTPNQYVMVSRSHRIFPPKKGRRPCPLSKPLSNSPDLFSGKFSREKIVF